LRSLHSTHAMVILGRTSALLLATGQPALGELRVEICLPQRKARRRNRIRDFRVIPEIRL
jgi:hypothetical protein